MLLRPSLWNPFFSLWHLKENIVILTCFLDQSVDTGITQLWTDVELCNKWQYQLPRQPGHLLHECILTGQTQTWYLQMYSSNKPASQRVNKSLYCLGSHVYIFWKTCYISIIILHLIFAVIQLRHCTSFLVAKYFPPACE